MKKIEGYTGWDVVRFYLAVVGATFFVIWLANHIEAI